MCLLNLIVPQTFVFHVTQMPQAYIKTVQLVIFPQTFIFRHFLSKRCVCHSKFIYIVKFQANYNRFLLVILWRTYKPCVNQGSKTLDRLTTNYLFIGWRPRISCSVLLLLVVTGSLVTSARSLWTDSEFVNTTELGVRSAASAHVACGYIQH